MQLELRTSADAIAAVYDIVYHLGKRYRIRPEPDAGRHEVSAAGFSSWHDARVIDDDKLAAHRQ